MNLSPARLVVLVALVVGGLAVLINGFDDDVVLAGGTGGSPAASPSESPQPSGEASPTASESPAAELEPQTDGVMVQVLNGTDAVGLAAQAEEFLVSKGYVAALPATDATSKPVQTTIVYFRAGPDADQNEVDAQNLADRFLKGIEADVKPLTDSVEPNQIAPKTQLVVLLGEDYADANPVA